MPTLRLDDFELYYETSGNGTPLLFIHGLGSSARDWEAQIAAFAKDYFVIAVDLRGHGRSGDPPGPYRITDFSRDINRLLDHLGCGPAHVVGVSLGGGIAFQLALDAPERVRSLVVVNSAPEMILRTPLQKFAIWQRRKLVKWLGLPRFGQILSKKLFPGDPAQAQTFATRFAGNRERPYTDTLNALIGWSIADRLGEIRIPTLILAADQDYTPVDFKRAYTAQMPNAELVVIPDSRHALPMERPEAFNRALAAFLGKPG
ncbi:alpha/beta fold hydrolase [Sinimarinibacterium thermocellulolyticum]|uniref:Alpha/beta fold hydrolase n=1 Tax=Sinimarinibacterium thermocellulolyticum TaxID=3170016 RepID=A0ABV2A7D5_9GAMM